jgi:hypothetical protein
VKLRGHNVVPDWDTSTKQLEAILSQHESQDSHAQQSQPVTRDNTVDQSHLPLPTYQLKEQLTNPIGLVVASTSAADEPDLLAAVAEGQTQPEPPEPDLPAGVSIPPCPHREIIALYAEALPTLTQPRVWEGQRETNLRSRWRWVMTEKHRSGSKAGQRIAETRAQGLVFFEKYFAYVAKSDFLTGRNGQWGSCDLEWLTKANNFAKVLEGKYENRQEVAA